MRPGSGCIVCSNRQRNEITGRVRASGPKGLLQNRRGEKLSVIKRVSFWIGAAAVAVGLSGQTVQTAPAAGARGGRGGRGGGMATPVTALRSPEVNADRT